MTQATDGLDEGHSTCRYSTSPSISKTFAQCPRSRRPRRRNTRRPHPLAGRDDHPDDDRIQETDPIEVHADRRCTQDPGSASCPRSSCSCREIELSGKSHETSTVGNADMEGTRSAFTQKCLLGAPWVRLLPGIRVQKATQESGDHLEQTAVAANLTPGPTLQWAFEELGITPGHPEVGAPFRWRDRPGRRTVLGA